MLREQTFQFGGKATLSCMSRATESLSWVGTGSDGEGKAWESPDFRSTGRWPSHPVPTKLGEKRDHTGWGGREPGPIGHDGRGQETERSLPETKTRVKMRVQ